MPSLAQRPAAAEFAPYYGRYIDLVPAADVVGTLRAHGAALDAMLRAIPESRGGFRYAEGKWSIREVIGHLIDAERIFMYRALRIARGDVTPLASFDENAYVEGAGSDARTVADLADEMRAVRDGTVRLLASLPTDAWSRMGVASEKDVSVRALAFITAGHAMHHQDILAERYQVASR
jgi:hypothetical protein